VPLNGRGRKIINKRVLLGLLLMLILLPLCAFGRKEARFAEIDSHIEQRDYSKALMLLQEYIIDHPEDFDSAQKRIQKIIESRALYSAKADELINVIISEPANDEKKLQMIAELESLEKNPSQASVDFIKQTKAAAQFTYFRSLFDELMDKGSREIEEGLYEDAVKTFYSGLSLYQEDFFEHNYSDEYVAPVKDQLLSLKKVTDQFGTDYENLIISFEVLKAQLSSGTPAAVIQSFKNFQTAFTSFSLSQIEINQAGLEFQDLFSKLSLEYKDLTEASFLPFAYRFILGKTDSPSTGIIAAYNSQWSTLIPSLKPLFTAFIKKAYSQSLAALQNTELPLLPERNESIRNSLALTKDLLETSLRVSGLYTLRETHSGNRDTDKDELFTTDTDLLLQLYNYFIAQLDSIQQINREQDSFLSYVSSLPPAEDSAPAYGENIFTSAQNVLSILDDMQKVEQDGLTTSRRASPTWKDEFAALSSLTDKAEKYVNNTLTDSWTAFAIYTETKASESSSPYFENYTKAETLLNPGLSINTDTFEILTYPRESIPVYNSVIASIDDQILSLNEKSRLITQSSELSIDFYNTELKTKNNSIQDLITRLGQIKSQSNTHIALANERIVLAERAKNEAVLRYNQALQALNTNNFQSARDNLQRSRTKYNESLSFQESKELREQSDTLLFDLGNSISKSENEVIVREIRQLKTEAKNAYYQGNFERAENLLTQAQSRWATTNVEPDTEITNLLSLVGTALSMKTGRVISTSAPLYPEMSQILSLAKQYFDQGKELIAKGDRAQGILILNEAKQKLRELQLVYPLNQEASLLTLRIDQVIDPDAFDALFEQKFTAAKADFRTTDKRQTAYADLLDLYAINPRYRGLGDFIYQAEIELGIKIKPPDQKALADSVRLTREAAAVVNSSSRDEIALSAALVKLNTAIDKNPDNEEAMVLKDRIQTIIGGKASVVLSSDSEALYQRAVQELQRGNTLQASALVSQLLQKKENQNSSKIIDLKKKVDSLL
jgi:outer membrane protein assembly factor BamD (BamD/ComL family)